MLTYLYVALGGALGSLARYTIAGAVARGVDEIFPWGTLVANVTGCFAIGLFAGLTAPGARFPASPELRVFVMVGICGGYTTFSSFGLQTMTLAQSGDLPRAALNVVASLTLCLLGVWLGLALAATLNPARG